MAAASHAVWNALVKNSDDQLLALTGLRVVGFPIAILLLVFLPWPSRAAVPYLIGNVLLMYAYYYFLLNSYRVGEFSSVYPIARGVAPLAVLYLAYLIGADAPSSVSVWATILVSAGIAIFAVQRHVQSSAVAYAVATGLAIAGYTFLAGVGVRHSESALGYLAWSELLTALGLIGLSVRVRKGRILSYLSDNRLRVLVSGILSISAFGIVLFVFQVLPLGPVTAVRESSVAFAVIIGVVFLREPLGTVKSVALLLVSAGIIIIATA